MLIAVAASMNAAYGDSATDVAVKVMSFNVRFSKVGVNEENTENNWAHEKFPRRERAMRVIREYEPDVLGVQEARHLQIVDLREAFPGFAFYGIGRDDGKTGGEYAGIFFRKDRFVCQRAGTFWLSATPEKPGTSFYTVPDAVPRLASWVRLYDKRSGCQFVVINTHWDHISEEARFKSAAMIRARLDRLSNCAPAIVMGDLNADEDSAPYRELMRHDRSARKRLIDSYRAMHRDRSAEESTFNHWAGTKEGSRIDFILHSPQLKTSSATIVRTSYDGRWPSDHYPITATLRLKRAQK
jgi:endonuclease/exonuclease/phosphatase family metal-dependent hydrolase